MELQNNSYADTVQHRLNKVSGAVGSKAVHKAFTETAVTTASALDALDTNIDAVLAANAAIMESEIAS